MIEHMLMVGNDGHEEDIASRDRMPLPHCAGSRPSAAGHRWSTGWHRLVGDELDATVEMPCAASTAIAFPAQPSAAPVGQEATSFATPASVPCRQRPESIRGPSLRRVRTRAQQSVECFRRVVPNGGPSVLAEEKARPAARLVPAARCIRRP